MSADQPTHDIAHGDRELSTHLSRGLIALRGHAREPALVALIDDVLSHRRSLRDAAADPRFVALLDAQRPSSASPPAEAAMEPEEQLPVRPRRAVPLEARFNVDGEDFGGRDGFTFLR